MYSPSHYLITDKNECMEFMQRYSFATLVTANDGAAAATHLPFIIETEGERITLYAHLAKANPQWKDFAKRETLVIFQGPHAYVSPAHYDEAQNVPTWDYVALHAYGRAEIVADKEAVLARLIGQHEAAYREQWQGFTADYREKKIAGIVAFRIVVEKLEGKKKLNQTSSDTERGRIVDHLEKSSDSAAVELAGYIKKL
jgi:transcriptional regulator